MASEIGAAGSETVRTPYSQANAQHTERAHEAAKRDLYPRIFACSVDKLSVAYMPDEGLAGKILDGDMAIDALIAVTVKQYRQPLTFTVQERFRKPEYARYRDLTITEWNHQTGLPSELYKIRAWLFVYGYYDTDADSFADAVCVNVPRMFRALAIGAVPVTVQHNTRSNQSFVALTFDDLANMGSVEWRLPQERLPMDIAVSWDSEQAVMLF